ncbi:MAG TPA: trigger factor, partial [Gammaproteobacteria bacterium]|nr:trigger factor [Gammaproteobacteria bacterium]
EREARKDDQLQVEFRTRIEGDEAHGDHGQQTSLVLGASTIENEIEDRLYGLKVGEEVVIDQRLPDDFHKAELAGRPVQYFIKLLSLYEPKLPALDEEFVRSLGVEDGTLESLRVEVRANMQRELEQAIKAKLRQQVMDTLLASNAIELPKALIDKEINSLVEQEKKAARGSAARPQDPATQQARHEATARRRVTLGLLLSDIVKTNEIKPDAARVRALVDTLASSYEDPAEVVKWYYGSSERLAQMESLALEEQVVDYVLERARVKNTDSTFDALMNPKQSEPA